MTIRGWVKLQLEEGDDYWTKPALVVGVGHTAHGTYVNLFGGSKLVIVGQSPEEIMALVDQAFIDTERRI